MKKHLYIMAAALATLTACSNEADQTADNGTVIELNPVFEETGITRAIDTGARLDGEEFWIWGDTDNGATVTNDIWSWKRVLAANPTKFAAPASIKKFAGTDPMNFYAMHGNFTSPSLTDGGRQWDADHTLSLTHQVKADQKEQRDYLESDLLYAVTNGVRATDGGVNLRFKHMLCKIEVIFKAGEGIEYDSIVGKKKTSPAPVSLLNINRDIVFNPERLTTPEDMDKQTVRPAYAWDNTADVGGSYVEGTTTATGSYRFATRESMLGATSNKGPIAMSPAATKNANFSVSSEGDEPLVYACAIIPPQTIEAGTEFLQITVNQKTGTYKLPSQMVFEAGKRYRFNLVLERKGDSYGFTPTVEKWPTESDGDAGGYYVIGVDF